VIIFSSGFSETGGGGVAMQQQLAEIAQRHNIGVIGPNCQGMINAADSVFAGFAPCSMRSTDGQSEHGVAVRRLRLFSDEPVVARRRLPFRQMVTTGNEIGISTLDFMDYFIRDPHTDIIGAYIEGVKTRGASSRSATVRWPPASRS